MTSEDEDFLLYLCDNIAETANAVTEFAKAEGGRSSIFEERLAMANAFVDAGNVEFKAGKCDVATLKYLAAAYHADFDFGQQWEMTPEHKSQIRKMKIRILLNTANIALKNGKFELAKRACTLGLKLSKAQDDTSSETVAKFLYRKGKALVELESFEEAMQDAKKALEILPTDAAIREVYVAASTGAKNARQDSVKMWKGKDLFSESNIAAVDLVLSDSDGKRINKSFSPRKGQTTVTAQQSFIDVVFELLCCKRKRD